MRLLSLLLVAGLMLTSCSEQAAEADTQLTEQNVQIKTAGDAKPMAMMMRAIYEQSRDIRLQLEAGNALDSAYYRFLEFHKLEPTDSTVLVEVFYKHNEEFKVAFENLLRNSDKASYNAMLTECVNCHEDFCPGPIKRIRKLTFEES
ncbi:MAG: hypothetical protein ACK417_12690 [Bacteroidia bacterium]|jgi:cytochrome c553